MESQEIAGALENLDRRMARVEQILPGLATKEELRQAIAPLATKEELREEGERSRRHMDVLVESLRSDLRVYAEGWEALNARDARLRIESPLPRPGNTPPL